MEKEFLSQDEVDALLKGVSEEADDEAVEENAENSGEIRPYNLATQERIVRGHLPMLEVINAQFARLFRVGLFNFMQRSAEVSVGSIRLVKYAEFVDTLAVPTNLNMVQIKPLRGTSLFIFDPNLVFLVVDNMFGGDGRFHARVEGREFTLTEQRIIQRLLEVAFESLEKSWQPIHPVHFEYLRSEMSTTFASIAMPNEVVVATTFTIALGSAVGEFHICMPYAMIEPIRDVLSNAVQGDQIEADKRWIHQLSREVQVAEVELVANLGTAELTLKQILKIKAGDVVSLDAPPIVTAEVDGVPVMECRYGISNGKYALKVQKMIHHGASERFVEAA